VQVRLTLDALDPVVEALQVQGPDVLALITPQRGREVQPRCRPRRGKDGGAEHRHRPIIRVRFHPTLTVLPCGIPESGAK